MVATLEDCEGDDMFWANWRIVPCDDDCDAILRDPKVWEQVNFTVLDSEGNCPNPYVFSGNFDEFVSGESDRLSFRSLWPPPEPSWIVRLWNRLFGK